MKKKNGFRHIALSTFIGIAVAGAGVIAPVSFVYADESADTVSEEDITADNDLTDSENSGDDSVVSFKVSDIIFSPENASPGDTVTVRALTNLNKHHISSLMLEIPINDEKTEHVHLVHGENDILEGSFTIGDNWANGDHAVSRLTVTDSGQSTSDYDLSGTSVGSFTVEGSNEDFDPPIVHSVTLDKTEARVGEAVTISVDVTHSSDIAELIVTFADEGNVTHSVSFEHGAKVHTKDLTGWDEGTYRVTGIFIRDNAGNREYYEENDNLDEVELPQLIISNDYADTQGPVVSSVLFDKEEAKPGDTVRITAAAHDSTGISYIAVEVTDREERKEIYYLYDDGEGKFIYDLPVTDKFLNGEYKITRIFGDDVLGNSSAFEPGDDTKDITVNNFSVLESSEDGEAPQISGIIQSGTKLRPGDTGSVTYFLEDKNDIWETHIGLYEVDTNEAFDTFEGVLQDDGSYRCEFTIDNQWYNGDYDIRIFASDSLEHSANHDTGLIVTVYDSAEDYYAPELKSVNVDKTELKPGDILTITAEVYDDSRIDYVETSFMFGDDFATGPDGEENIYTFIRDTDGLYKAYIPITDRFLNGDYEIFMHLTDEWDNYEYNIDSEVAFTVNGSIEDQEGPAVTSVLFDKEKAVPGDEFTVTVEADDPSGIDHILIHIGPITDTYHAKYNPHLYVTLYPDEDGNFKATDLVDNSWENASYDVDFIDAVDSLGNYLHYMEPAEFEEDEYSEHADITKTYRHRLYSK